VKAVNQWYNKEKARLQQIYAQQQEDTGQKFLTDMKTVKDFVKKSSYIPIYLIIYSC